MRTVRIAFCCCVFALLASAQPPGSDIDAEQAARQEWFYSQRAYPLGHIPTSARLNAIEQVRRTDLAARARGQFIRTAVKGSPAATMDSANWTLIGPKPTNLGSTRVTAGRVNAIAIDPRDSNTIYLGAAEGGVWKTTDGGINWTPLTDSQPSLAMGAIALDPSNPDIVYAGTGEENFAQDSYYGAGILKSTDGGATWTNIVGPFLRARIGAIAIHPNDTQILLCSTDTGIWRSTDGAQNWTQVLLQLQGAAIAAGTGVFFDPTDGNIAYAALGSVRGNSKNGVYRSTDAGKTWQLLPGSGANSLPTTDVGRIELAIAPSTPTTLYAQISNAGVTNSSAFGTLLGIYKTTDSGVTWNQLPNTPTSQASQFWYNNTLRVHPKNPNIVYAGGFSIYRSMDGGSTWAVLPTQGPNGSIIHVDEHYLAFTPDGSKLFIGNDGGIYSTIDITSPAVNWTELNDTLAITEFYPGLSLNPANPDFALGGTQDNSTQMFSGKPAWNTVACGDGGFTNIDPSVPAIGYTACQNIAVLRSASLGASSAFSSSAYGIASNDRTQFISPFVMDPSSPQTLYFGTYRLWQTRDGAGLWRPISPDLSVRTGTIKTVAVAPGDSHTVYIGTSDSQVQVTHNALDATGVSWNNQSSGLPPRTITHIAVDPYDPATAYATFSGFSNSVDTLGHIFKTSNGGGSWTDISGNLANTPVNDLVIDPDLPNTLYIGTDVGVLASADGGATWSTLGKGLPIVVVDSLVLHRGSRVLRAGTHGRSVWDILVPISSPSAQPTITSLSPGNVNAGGGNFSLAVTGTNFAAGTMLQWNSEPRPTNIVDSTHLTAQITAADIAGVGRAAIQVFNPARGGGASNVLNLPIGPAPQTSASAFVNAANPTGGNTLGAGAIASLYGTNLAPRTITTDNPPPLPFTLGGTSISMNGTLVPLFFVSANQINFQVPYFVVSSTAQVPLTITQGTLNQIIAVSIARFSPALFTTNGQGTGQASALIAGTASVAAPVGMFPGSRPVKKGEFLSLYCTGLGDVSNRPSLGSPSPTSPLSMTLTKPSASIGGADASVTFSGLAPGFVGLYQVNVQVPNTALSGNAVQVSLSIGGLTSNTATVAIE